MTAGQGPDFLVVGAQKCGTTTLYEDLRSHPQIHVLEKESSRLLDPAVTTVDGCRRYREAFGTHPDDHVTGEVSTAYTMLPTIDAVRAAEKACNAVKIIYIVRDPVARVISQHHHHYSAQMIPANIDQAVLEYPQLVDNSRYATQISPWIEAFGRESVRVVRFEDYTAARVSGCTAIQHFLGVSERPPANPDTAYNTSAEKRVATGQWRRLRTSALYQVAVRPLLSRSIRGRIAHTVLPRTPVRPDGPSDQTREFLIQELTPEVSALAELLGTAPWWDLSTHDRVAHLRRSQ